MTRVPVKRGNWDTERSVQWEDAKRYKEKIQGEDAMSQGEDWNTHTMRL